jgi:hypothetical protein
MVPFGALVEERARARLHDRLHHEGLDVYGEHHDSVAKVAEVGDAIGDHDPVKLKVEHHDVGRLTGTSEYSLNRIAGRDYLYPAVRVGCDPAAHALDDDVGVLDEGDADGSVQRA